MEIKRWNGRACLFEWEDGIEGLEVFKHAYFLGILPEGKQVFLGSSRFFCRVENGVMRTYRMRENWNGWHDCAAYSLPNFEDIGTKICAEPSRGQHRDVVTIE